VHVGILWFWKWRVFDELDSSKRAIRNPLFLKRQFPWTRRAAPRLCARRARGTTAVRAGTAVNRSRLSGIEMNDRFLGELAARLAELAASNPAKDLEKNFRGLLSSAFARLELVSREEYDVQVQVLARAREQLAALEARVAELEARKARPTKS
jgi:BMFP domain-containing protein YqiC